MLAGQQKKSHWVSIIHNLHAFTKNQYTIWMDVGWTKNISHRVPVIHDSHAFTKNQCTTRAASTQMILFVKILKFSQK